VTAPAVARSLIVGVHCRRGHFNDPRVPYCSICGISMIQQTRVPVAGRRPALGVLTLDDGTAYPLHRGYVLGRAPDRDPLVRAGRARPVLLADRAVSRLHARVLSTGWDVAVADAGSTNGTLVRRPGEKDWRVVPAGSGMPLVPGSRLRVGPREVRYDSHRPVGVLQC